MLFIWPRVNSNDKWSEGKKEEGWEGEAIYPNGEHMTVRVGERFHLAGER